MDLLWAVAALLVLFWALGYAFHFTLGGLIHVLLVLAVISVLLRIIGGYRHRTA
jgi:hypothetical protein